MAYTLTTQYAHDAQPKEPVQNYKPGFYSAKIVEAEEKYSRSGKPMLALKLEVDPGGPKTVDVNEYLLLESGASWKVEQYLAAIGLQFAPGQEITIDANTFLGGRLYVLTCNEPGQKHPERLYLKPLKAFRKMDIPHEGPLTETELEHWGLNPDGTRKGSRDEQRMNAQPLRPQQNSWGAQPQPLRQQQGGWGAQQQGYAQPAYQQSSAPLVQENLEDDDIPF